MIDYFLGKLSAEREQQIEKQFFDNDQLFDCLQAVKEELIDCYLHEQLSAEDRQLFEKNFLGSPAHRQQVQFARSLMQTIPAFSK